MRRAIRLLGAPTNLGLAPYRDGTPRRVDEAPGVLRELGLTERLAAEDLGDVAAPPYRDLQRGDLPIRNADLVAEHARRLAESVQDACAPDHQLVVLGGDCSIVLGALLGLHASGRFGLVFIDGHCDFARPDLSWSGGAAGMDLALAMGLVEHPLARLAGDGPLVQDEDVVLLARKDLADEPEYGDRSVRLTAADDVPVAEVQAMGIPAAVSRALQRVARPELDGFWIHVDADVLLPEIMPAVDSPEPGGLTLADLAALLRGLLAHPGAVGVDVTIYDPGLDPDRVCGKRMVEVLAAAFADSLQPAEPP